MIKKNINPIGKRREKQKVETYDLILKSARYLFKIKGFEKTTIRGVAAHAEIASGTIYKHFQGKTALLAAAFYDDLERLFSKAQNTIPKNDALRDQFLHLIRYNLYFYTSNPKLSREYLLHIPFAGKEWIDQIDEFEKLYLETVEELVRSAQQRGEIDKKKDGHFVAISLMANYFYVLSDLFLKQKVNDMDQIISFLKEINDQVLC